MSLKRNAPMPRGKELERKAWMPARTVPMPRGTGVARAPQKPKARRDTGPTRAVRKLVLERDGYACVCCGVSVIGRRYSLQHRVRRSHGGGNGPENLIVVLGWGGEGCHGRIDFYKDPADGAKGYRLPSAADPARVPVILFSPAGPGVTVWLTADGRYSHEAPEEAAA